MTRPIAELRSQRWFAQNDFRSFGHRQRMQQAGLRREDFKAKSVDCASCGLRKQCLQRQDRTSRRKVVRYHPRQIDFNDPSHRMRQASGASA